MSNIKPPSARALILKLLAVVEGGTLNAAEAVRAGALFNISENSLRVALARLAQANLVETFERGAYRLGPKGRQLGADVAAWRSVENRLCDWQGGWIAVATGGLPRRDRKVLRARERALSMLGMLELDSGLFVRPDNLRDDIVAVRARLADLGLCDDAAVFRASDFDPVRQNNALHLWDGLALADGYRARITQLTNWLDTADDLPLETAARQSYLLGDDTIRRIVFDPMLPAPLVDETARHAFIQAMIRFDDKGRQIWARFLGSKST